MHLPKVFYIFCKLFDQVFFKGKVSLYVGCMCLITLSKVYDGSKFAFEKYLAFCSLLCSVQQNSGCLFSSKTLLNLGGSEFKFGKCNLGMPKMGKWSVASNCITLVLIWLLLRLLMTWSIVVSELVPIRVSILVIKLRSPKDSRKFLYSLATLLSDKTLKGN